VAAGVVILKGGPLRVLGMRYPQDGDSDMSKRRWEMFVIPNGQSGEWRVETFEVSEEDVALENMRMTWKLGMGRRTISPGKYQRLMRGSVVVMSNTDAEINDHRHAMYKMRDSENVLINGLGLGVVLRDILDSDTLKSVTVIEISEDVIRLVGPTFQDDERVNIVCCDAFKYKPPKGIRYGVVWHDIWDYICADNLLEMHRLHRKYGKRADWQGSWCRSLCEMYK